MSATERIVGLLQLRHPGPEWATFVELADSTGARASRRFDVFAMNLWPSKKFRSVAYEIKVSRADFMREIDRPEKRERAEQFAGECYFVTPAGLVKPDEVPEGWGLLVETKGKGGLRRVKAATQRTVTEPWPPGFIASIARRSVEPRVVNASKALWTYAGKELTAEQLLEIAKDQGIHELRAEKAKIEKAAVDRFVDGTYGDLTELREAVSEVTGHWSPTAASFRQWLSKGGAGQVRPALVRALRVAGRAIEDAIEHAESVEAVRDPTTGIPECPTVPETVGGTHADG